MDSQSVSLDASVILADYWNLENLDLDRSAQPLPDPMRALKLMERCHQTHDAASTK